MEIGPRPRRIYQASKTELGLEWPDGPTLINVRNMRLQCPCAVCVDEKTGERTIKEADIREDIHPREIRPVGNYALGVKWSDGHDTGLYTFDLLKELGNSA